MSEGNTIVLKGLTDMGRVRELNEDSFGTPRTMGISEPAQMQRGVLFAVADGMGAHAAGEVASRMAIETLFKTFYASPTSNPGDALMEAYTAANRAIYEFASKDPARSNMGTTLVAGVIKNRKLWVANVGDSRAYLIRGTRVEQITHDHSWVAEQVRAKVITEEQAQRHVYKNIVTRAVGTQPQVKVDLFRKRLQTNDVVLLCSDGLSNHVAPEDIQKVISATPDPTQITEQLIALANERGGDDNITAIAVHIPAGGSTLPLLVTTIVVATLLLLATGLMARVVLEPLAYPTSIPSTPSLTVPAATPTFSPTSMPTLTPASPISNDIEDGSVKSEYQPGMPCRCGGPSQ
jgi:serine/threonine protein phosphatase PrpC